MKRTLLFLASLIFAINVMAQLDVYTPSLKSPLNGATDKSPKMTISWNPIVGSSGLQYQVQLDTSANFNSPLKVDTTVLLVSGYTTHELLFGQTYYWRVRAIDLGQTSYWSSVWNFKVFTTIALSSPATDSVFKDPKAPNVSLTWRPVVGTGNDTVKGVRFYDYQYDTDRNFSSPQLFQGTVAGNLLKANTANLRFGTKYYWRARARHNLDTSLWSLSRVFCVTDTMSLTKPTNNAVNQNIDVQLTWEKLGGLLAYEFQVASDPDYTSVVFEGETTEIKMVAEMLHFGVNYYWHVRGRHQLDTSSWGDNFKFTVINTVLLESPANNSINIPLKPTLNWRPQTGILGYQVQLDSLPSFTTPTVDYKPKATDTLNIVTRRLVPGKLYYWRMRAFSNGGISADTTDWSIPWTFMTTNATGIDENNNTAMAIYPNPANEKLTVRVDAKENCNARFILMDMLGKSLITQELTLTTGANVKEIMLENIHKGVYIVRLTINGQTLNHKLIVDK